MDRPLPGMQPCSVVTGVAALRLFAESIPKAVLSAAREFPDSVACRLRAVTDGARRGLDLGE